MLIGKGLGVSLRWYGVGSGPFKRLGGVSVGLGSLQVYEMGLLISRGLISGGGINWKGVGGVKVSLRWFGGRERSL